MRDSSAAGEGLQVQVLGGLAVSWQGRSLTLSRKSLLLVAYLAIERRVVPRGELARLLWPEKPGGEPRIENLRQELKFLRRQPGAAGWLRDGALVEVVGFTDLAVMREALAGRDYRRAIEVWGGGTRARGREDHLLLGLDAGRLTPRFQEWLNAERVSASALYESVLRAHATDLELLGDLAGAIGILEEVTATNPLAEGALHALMQLEARRGNLDAALQHHERACRRLREFDVEPSRVSLDLAAACAVRSSASRASRPVVNLRRPLTSFVGRARELEEVGELLRRAECRLLTLHGPGGVGKTRLAQEAATACAERFAHGAHLVPLAPVGRPERAPLAIAEGLGLQLSPSEDPLQGLLRRFRERELLLVLDNFEQVMPAATWVTELLRSSPASKILVASREPLNVEAEWPYELHGLPYPEHPQVEDFERYDAVALFIDRARRVAPRFRVTEADRPHILRICRQARGLPFALERAAERANAFSPREIADQIEPGTDSLASTR